MFTKSFLSSRLCCVFILLTIASTAQQKKYVESLPKSRPFIHTPRNGFISSLFHSAYRSYDGTNNNVGWQKNEWGAADIALYRELPAAYASSDWKNAMNGTNRPSARQISNVLCDEPVTQFNSRNLSTFVYVWGQFLDHDITLTPGDTIEYAPVILPANETIFTLDIPFFRSAKRTGTGVTNARQQTNLNTAWIDGSVVYGADSTRARWLRTLSQGKMKTSTGNFLPYNTVNGQLSGAIDLNAPSMGNDSDHTAKVFVAGDVRASEHPGITALHTLFVREHNRICNSLVAQGYSNDEQIYQIARKRVGALIAAITYQEFLPAMGVVLSSYTGYKNYVRPDIMNTFATAGYRIGHTMVADEVALRDNNCLEVGPGDLDLGDIFFDNSFILTYGLDPFLKGFSTHKQYETDNKINSVLRNFLFGNLTDPVRFGLDLAALNIQRGRDHGLPSYSTVRAYYGCGSLTSFSQITSDTAKASALKSLYGSVNNIDLWVGLLAEDRLPGKSVGKTMHAMLKSQFEKLRDGDYYFYKNDPYLGSSIRNQTIATKFSDVIKRNTSITNIQSNVFFIDPCPGEDGEDRLSGAGENSEEISPGNVTRAYPNPVVDVLHVELGSINETCTIYIYASSGILVKTNTLTGTETSTQIDVRDFKPGVYVMQIISGNKTNTMRFVKMTN